MNPADALRECREKIDDVDRRLVALLNERTVIVEQIGRIKSETSMPVYEPSREDAVFANVARHNTGPITIEALKGIFERIIDEMRKVQKNRMAGKT